MPANSATSGEYRQLARITAVNLDQRKVQAVTATGIAIATQLPRHGQTVHIPAVGEVWTAVQTVTSGQWRLDSRADETAGLNAGIAAASPGDVLLWPGTGRVIVGDRNGPLVDSDGLIPASRVSGTIAGGGAVEARVVAVTGPGTVTVEVAGREWPGIPAVGGLYEPGAAAVAWLGAGGEPVAVASLLALNTASAEPAGALANLVSDLAGAVQADRARLDAVVAGPYGKVTTSQPQQLPTGTWVDWQTFTEEPAGRRGIGFSNPEFTCQRAGVYRLAGGVAFAGAASMVGCVARINGIDLMPSRVLVAPSRPCQVQFSTLHSLSAGDRVRLAAYHNTGQAINGTYAWLEVSWVTER